MKAKIVYMALALVLVFSLTAVAIVPAGPVHAVSGDQYGTWTVGNSPYIVTGDVTVPVGQTLTIEPGVEVKFVNNHVGDLWNRIHLYVDGTLVAEGTSGSNIVFTSNEVSPAVNDWYAIYFNTGSTGSVKYCDIAYGTIPVYLNSVSGSSGSPAVTIENCNIHDSGYTLINLLTSDYNTIKGNTVTLIGIGQAIYLDSSSHNLVENNTCSSLGSQGSGIRLVANNGAYSDNIVRGNTVHDIALGITINTAEGMNATDILIEGNTCYDNTNGIGLESSYGGVAQDITVTGNTFYNHSSATIISRTWRWPDWVDPHPWGTFSNVNITGNDITESNTMGIYILSDVDATAFAIHNNNILLPSDLWAAYNGGTGTLDATSNWWGDATGPRQVTTNPDGLGGVVSDDVNYSSWLTGSVTKSVTTATGTGTASFSSDGGALGSQAAVAEGTLPTEGKPNLEFPHGLFSFNIVGLTPGDTATVTITLPSAAPVGTQYWKYHASEGGWIQIPMDSDDGDNVITITLVDGGLGDDDGVANGVIDDQGGPGSPPAPEPTPAPTPTPEEEGACFIATAAYGTSTAEEIDTLRAFRDEVLLQSSLGSQLVALYYEVSPPVADFISEHEGLRTLVRELLVDPVVWLVDAIGTLWRD